MSVNPKVSVCVNAYNQEHYIYDCLISILTQQTDFDFEVIVGDDCSTDQTTDIIKQLKDQYPERLKIIHYEKNVGPYINFNYTHSLATGKYVAHCDGDDLFLPGKLQKQVDFLDSHLDFSVCWHKSIYFNDRGKEALELSRPGITGIGEVITLDYVLRVGTVATHSSIMYRKEARKTFNPDFKTIDLFYTIEYLASGKGMILKEPLGKYRVNAANSFSKTQKQNFEVREICIKHWEYALSTYPNNRGQIFIFSVVQMLIDFKNKKPTWKGFLKLVFKSIGFFSLYELIDTFRSTRYLRIPDEIRYS